MTNKVMREDQARAVDALRASIGGGKRRIVMQGPTGYGKGFINASMIEGALSKRKRALVTVPALSLVDQTVQVLWDEGVRDIGVIQANHSMTDWSKPVQVASVQTLQRREEIPEAAVVFIDECHVWFKFYERLLLAPERRGIVTVGLSATPWIKGLGRYYQDLVVADTIAGGIEKGYLSPFRVFVPSHPDLKGVRTVAGDYHEGDLAERVNKTKLTADVVSTWKARGEGRPTICFAVNRAHAKALAEQFNHAGVGAASMDCDTPPDERADIRRRMLAGEIKVVSNVDVIGMGVDWPEVSCISYVRPTKSEIRFVQNIGRGLRRADGKSDLIILDHSDTHLNLGFVTDIHYDTLDDGRGRLSERDQSKPALPKECPKCAYLKPPRKAECPNCGFKCEAHARVAINGGELGEVKRSPKRSKTADKLTDKRQTYGMLLWYAESKGYKPGWAANKYRDIYDVWPRGMDGVEKAAPNATLASWIRSQNIKWARSKRRNGGDADDHHAPSAAQERPAPLPTEPGAMVAGTLCTVDDFKDFA